MAEYRLDYRLSLLTAGTVFPSLPERMRLTEHGPAYQINSYMTYSSKPALHKLCNRDRAT